MSAPDLGAAALLRRPARRPPAPRAGHLADRLITYGLYALLSLIVLFPLAWVLLGSFKNPSEIFAYPTSFWPRHFTSTNYGDVIRRTALPTYLFNTFIVTAFTLVLSLSIATVAA